MSPQQGKEHRSGRTQKVLDAMAQRLGQLIQKFRDHSAEPGLLGRASEIEQRKEQRQEQKKIRRQYRPNGQRIVGDDAWHEPLHMSRCDAGHRDEVDHQTPGENQPFRNS